MPASQKPITGATGAWVYVNIHFTEVFLTEAKSNVDTAQTLKDFCQDVGLPEHIKSDQASELCNSNSEFLAVARKGHINLTYAELDHSNQMWKVNVEIRELKTIYHKIMVEKKVPKRLWSYGFRQAVKTRQFLPRASLNNRAPMERVTGNTQEISEYLDFDFYDLVWY
jgi:hypothetical protein